MLANAHTEQDRCFTVCQQTSAHTEKGEPMRSINKRLTEEDRFSRKFACWANNHKGWSKTKKRNRRLARRKIRRGDWERRADEHNTERD